MYEFNNIISISDLDVKIGFNLNITFLYTSTLSI